LALIYLFAVAAFSLTFELLLVRTVFTVFTNNMIPSIVAVSSFGFAMGGLIYYVLGRRPARWETAAVAAFTPMFALYLITFSLLNHQGFELQDFAVPLVLVLTTLFFAGPGYYAAFMFSTRGVSTEKTYAYDMLGAGFGALVPVVGMQFFGREVTVILAITLLSAALSLALWRRRPLNFALCVPFVVGGLFLGWQSLRQPWVCKEFRSKPQMVNFHSDAMVNINWISGKLESARRSRHVPITEEDRSKVHATYLARLDCRGHTMTVDYKSLEAVRYIESEIHSLPFIVKNMESGAFLGTGLGMDLVRAEYFGIKKIAAFEINKYLISLEKQLLGDRSLYEKPHVQTYLGDARRSLTALDQKFDLVYISSAKNYGRVGINSGAILLNRLVTYEAIQTYWDRLNEDGFLYFVDLSSHILRTAANVRALLEDKGLSPGSHMIFGEDGSHYTGLLLSKRQLTADQLLKVESAAQQFNWEINNKLKFFNPDEAVVTDDRPNLARLTQKLPRPFLAATLIALFLAIMVAGWPLMSGTTQPFQTSVELLSLCLSGMVFISVQIAFLYSLELLFDWPVFTVALTLVMMLIASAGGALLNTTTYGNRSWLARSILALVLLLLTLQLDQLVHLVYLASWPWRIVFAAAVIVPCSIFLGMIFPFHLSRLSKANPTCVALGVGINGIGTLLGGLMSTWLVGSQGISWLLAASFALSLILVYTSSRSSFSNS
jgi:SAM-dependent methyltransferase